ncbi:uncharacterized protein isoform X2 [Rhodnius prolixus]|uniref:uncharacterized protein isoform X2 n=1 Tax=Rhodnius prolixus TaxID=13249 RepID=UPI003D18BDF6
MSDTDDTDVLLLIPPNFFLINTDQEDSGSDIERNTDRSIVSNLLSQVYNLETRVNHIETLASNPCSASSLSDFDNHSVVVNNVSEFSGNNIVLHPDSTSETIDSEYNFRAEVKDNLEIDYINNKTKENLLGEIDSFIDNKYKVKTMDRFTTIDSLFQNGSPTKRLALPEVDKLLKEMETTQTEIENKLRMREIEHGIIDKNKQQLEVSPRKMYTMGETVSSIPDRGFGIRDMFATQNTPGKAANNVLPSSEETCIRRDAYLVGSSNSDEVRKSLTSSSLSRSPMKDYTSPTKVATAPLTPESRRKSYLSPRRRLQMNSDFANGGKLSSAKLLPDQRTDFPEERAKQDTGGAGDSQEPRFKPDGGYSSKIRTFNNPRGNLLSLSELWRSENDLNVEDPIKLKQKLEEEKYRRLHLENTVQTLQRRVLEEQEKVAVAMKVDEGKDRAIGLVTEAWKQMVQHWRQIESERHAMSQTLITERSEIAKQKDDIEKKITRYEKEMSQTLDLAEGYKKKYELLENELAVLKESSEQRIRELEEALVEREETVKELKDERKSLADRLQVSKAAHEEEKRLVESARRDVSMLQEQLSKCEAELAVVKEQRDLLSTRLKEEKGRSSMLDGQKMALTEALDATNSKLAKAEEEVKATALALEKSKSELRAVYQSQLESVVRDKVAEFQAQLDRAQAVMQVELENTKRQAEEVAHRQQQALVNSHVAEMRRLESIHKEELRAIESKLAESERRRTRLENGKKDIAQRLHGVMESQWRQALNIITSELSVKQNEGGPGGSRLAPLDADHTSYKYQQRNLMNDDTTSIPSSRKRLSIKNTGIGGIHLPPESEASDETPFNKDGQMTSRSNNVGPLKQPQLMDYIQTLLDRQPGKPVDTTTSSITGGMWPDTDTTGDHSQHWAQIIQNNPAILSSNASESMKPSQTSKKPPWKPT